MASKRDRDEEVVITFRGRELRVPIHWRTDAEVRRRAKLPRHVDGFYDSTSGHIWVSLHPTCGRRKALDHELEHALVEWRQKVWNGE